MGHIIRVGVSEDKKISPSQYEGADYLELKHVSGREAERVRSMWPGPVYLHVQYSPGGRYLLPTSDDLGEYREDLRAVAGTVSPPLVSLHFGPSTRGVEVVDDLFLRGDGPVLSTDALLGTMERNLVVLGECFPHSGLLVENMEYCPEFMSEGACAHITEPAFFSRAVNDWHRRGLIHGIVFDIGHALITAGNHPGYESPDGLQGRLSRYLSGMPLHLVRELHISGIGQRDDGTYVDTHRVVGETELAALISVLDYLTAGGDISITIEHDTNLPRLISAVRKRASAHFAQDLR